MPSSLLRIEGAYTALITPFKGNAVDHDALAALVERQIDSGIDGLVPCGTTGEAATMSVEERLAVIKTVVRAAEGRVPVVAGTGTNDTRVTIEFTKQVSQLGGVDAALVVTPYYNKPGQNALVRHFTEVAEQGGLPVVLYNVPGRTSVSMSAETVAKLASHDNIIALKEATGDMILGARIRELVGDSIQLLSGDDFTTFPLLTLGATGCISVLSNLDPAAMSTLCRHVREGDVGKARAVHYSILPLARALFTDSNPVPVKTAAALLGWCEGDLRAPLYPAEADVLEKLKDALHQYGLLYL